MAATATMSPSHSIPSSSSPSSSSPTTMSQATPASTSHQQPPPAASTSGIATTSFPSTTSPTSPSKSNTLNAFAVREIPPFRPKINQRTATDTSIASSSLSTSTSGGSTAATAIPQHRDVQVTQQRERQQQQQRRDRRTSQASNNSNGSGSNSNSNSRRNSAQYIIGSGAISGNNHSRHGYPSPAPSSPASSPTHVHAQFFPTSSTLPSGLSSLASPSVGSDNLQYYAPGASTSTASPSSSTTSPYASPQLLSQQQNTYTFYNSNNSGNNTVTTNSSGKVISPGMAMLQGIEAQLQIPAYRGGRPNNSNLNNSPSISTTNSSSNNSSSGSGSRSGHGHGSRSGSGSGSGSSKRQSTGIPLPVSSPLSPQQQQQVLSSDPASRVSGPTHRIPAVHQTQHRPASTTVVPIQASSSSHMQYPAGAAGGFATPQHQLQQQHNMHASASAGVQASYLYTPEIRSHLSQSTRVPLPAGVVTSAATTSSAAAHYLQQQQQQQGGAGGNGAAAAAHRNRASHQIVPVTALANVPPQVPTIALHTAQYSQSNRQKVFFGDYQLLHTLGEGEFGKVKLGVHAQRWGEEVAIKLIKKGSIDNAARSLKVQREIDVLRIVRHPHIVRLVDVVETDRYIGIVLEYASGGELFEYILAHKYLRENVACKLFAQLISGVAYLHAKKVVHRDLKLENLLLDRNRNIIITDFGFANRFSEAGSDLMATSCGSPCYAAPELVLQDGQYVGSAVDVWSCGVILYAMLSGYLPYDDDPNNPDGDNINLLYRYITSTKLSFPDWISPEPRDLLLMMLVPDPRKRCTLRDVMRHPWLARYSPFFQNAVEDLEAQADAAYEEKKMLLQRQQEAYYQQLAMRSSINNVAGGLNNSQNSAMARSMSTPGVDQSSSAQQRHRSAMVTTTATTQQRPGQQQRQSAYLPGGDTSSNLSQSVRPSGTPDLFGIPASMPIQDQDLQFIDPFAQGENLHLPTANSNVDANIIPPFSAPIAPPGPSLLPTSMPMAASTSAPGDFEGTSDSLTTEGEMRGEPRSRRGDDDDASTTSSARAARNSAIGAATAGVSAAGRGSTVSTPSNTGSSNNGSDSKRRKGDEKRHTVQLEYTSPPADSTRSKTKARESLNSSHMSTSATAPQLPMISSMSAGDLGKLPLIDAAAAADDLGGDVHMASTNTSPARSARESQADAELKQQLQAPSTPPQQIAPHLAAAPTVSPVQEQNEFQQDESSNAKTETNQIKTTPPSSPSRSDERIKKTPKRNASASATQSESEDLQRTPRASVQIQSSQQQTTMPFPSPKQEVSSTKQRPVTMAVPIERNASTRSRESANPSTGTQGSSRSSQRHRKGLSTDKAFFSRLLGSSTTSVNKTDATGEGSRSRTSSQIEDREEVLAGAKATEPSDPVVDELGASGRRGAGRRKALSLVVDPFGRSSNGLNASAAARNRRSAKIQTATVVSDLGPSSKASAGQNQNSGVRTSNIPMSPSMPMSPSLQAVHQPLRQIPPSSASGGAAPPSPFSTRSTETNKSKRVSDWFRWKSVSRSSAAQSMQEPVRDVQKPEPERVTMTRSSSTRQRHSSAIQPTVVVTGATPQPPHQSRTQQLQHIDTQVAPRVVATPADARNLTNNQPSLLTSQRSLRARPNTTATDPRKAVQFDENRLKVHNGATDKRIVTKTSPPLILEDVRRVLFGMGIQVVPDTEFRLTCTRKSRKQSAALASQPLPSAGLTPSPSSTFRSFFSRKNSATPATSAITASPSMPSPALTVSSTMDAADSASLSPTVSAHSQMQLPLPYYGAAHDGGGEVRFTVEVVRVKHLNGLYTLDFRRLKGALTDYKENHETCIERLSLSSAV